MLKLQNKMVTIHVKLVHMLPTISTQNPAHLFVCLCVPTTPQSSKSKKATKKIYLLAATFSCCCCCCWKCCCHPCCFLGGGPPLQVQPRLLCRLLCCCYVAKVSFSLFWKRTGSRREKEKVLNLVFFFSFPSLNLVFLFPH